MDPFVVTAGPLVLGYGLDLLLGDPRWLPHPVVAFGRAIGVAESRLNRGADRFLKGFFLALVFTVGVFFLVSELDCFCAALSPVLSILFRTGGIFFALANRTLIAEGRAVFAAVDTDLDQGRRRLSWIVGRDTSDLDAQSVRVAVLETMSENLCDGVVAPLFFYGLLGLPGMMAYKMVNTLDSMIGHKNERYFAFGKTAARLDDMANFFPARLTALLMLLVAPSARAFRFILRYGRAHDSPNAGYPEAALAGILDLRFGGPHCYDGERVEKPWIGQNARLVQPQEIQRVARINHQVCFAALVIAGLFPWLSLLVRQNFLRQ